MDGNNIMSIVIYILSILAFTIFDIIGYYYILSKKETYFKRDFNYYLYRVIQILVQIGISYYLYTIDYRLTIAFLLSWWFGLCDLLYYWLRLYWIKSNDMFWLWWTPYGIVHKIINKKIDYKYLIVFSILSIIISLAIL